MKLLIYRNAKMAKDLRLLIDHYDKIINFIEGLKSPNKTQVDDELDDIVDDIALVKIQYEKHLKESKDVSFD